MVMENTEWMDRSACRDVFKDPNYSQDIRDWFDSDSVMTIKKVKDIFCNQCPVLINCHWYAIKNDLKGPFAGISNNKRTRIRNKLISKGALERISDE